MYPVSAAVKTKTEKDSGLNRIQTRDLCDSDAVLFQLSYQANWALAILKDPIIYLGKRRCVIVCVIIRLIQTVGLLTILKLNI